MKPPRHETPRRGADGTAAPARFVTLTQLAEYDAVYGPAPG